ncbi:MAG: YraN family protein [Firmicutes bacterium]|nr:YraN family protein [Bacillota bacterium]MDD7602801.1 YraN family protein [Bacillota bacterium]MDY5855744.1 YraN family protein [Anaerovoracaceae bacterium]
MKTKENDTARTLGKLGEELAEELLKQEEYEILARNYRCPYGEIDLIAEKDGVLAFLEVKTRRSSRYGTPAEAVSGEKQRKIRQTAASFLAETDRHFREMEFQVMEITVRHLKGLSFQEVGIC